MEIHGEKQAWNYNGKNFRVEVVRWTDTAYQSIKDKIPFILFNTVPENHWNVYAYIFPNHPFFNKIVSDSLYDYGIDLPFHCGPSYHKWDYDAKGEVINKQIGSDYQHLHDDEFGQCKTKEDAWRVFEDADELIEILNIQSAQ